MRTGCARQGIRPDCVGRDQVAVLDPTGSVDRIFRQYLNVREFDNPSPLQELLGQDVLQLTAFFDADYEKMMLPRMPHCVSGRWHPEFTDITAREADKGKGIQAIARHMGFDPSRTIAFGDGGNDLSMILQAGTPPPNLSSMPTTSPPPLMTTASSMPSNTST